MARARRARLIASVCGALALAALLDAPSALGQTPPSGGKPDARPPEQTAPPPDIEAVDVFDLLRTIRNKELTAEQKAAAIDPSRKMYAFAPVIGYKPSSGVMVGVAGNVAFFRGDPATTHISSAVASLTFSSPEADVAHRPVQPVRAATTAGSSMGTTAFQWTSQDTFGLGTETTPADKVNMAFDYFRVYETVYRTLRRHLRGHRVPLQRPRRRRAGQGRRGRLERVAVRRPTARRTGFRSSRRPPPA